MNISKKTQYGILAAIGGCGLFFIVIQFVIVPAITTWKDSAAKTKEMQATLTEMRQVVQSRPQVQEQIERARSTIQAMTANIPLPVLGNYLLDMELHIRTWATNNAVEVVSVADNDVLALPSENALFKIYRVRVQSKAGLHDLISMAADIHRNNPLVSITGLNITALDGSPSVHDVNFLVSWLIWSDPAKRPQFLIATSEKK